MNDRIRLTITVSPEVHETFSRMAELEGVSLGRSMGDWLESTREGAEFITSKVLEVKSLPSKVHRQLAVHLAAASTDNVATGEMQRQWQQAFKAMRDGTAPRSGDGPALGASEAPSSNTGLNPPAKGKRGRA